MSNLWMSHSLGFLFLLWVVQSETGLRTFGPLVRGPGGRGTDVENPRSRKRRKEPHDLGTKNNSFRVF